MKELEMNLLYILGEECSEVVQAISKANRFGFDTKFESNLTNAEKISYEMADLVAVYEMLVEHNIIPKYDDKLKQLKKDKVINLYKEFTNSKNKK
jgi:NTP pyrophosphatase (non-canonical NTP hydrolase)|tara:strand:+ start:830 stop:1114 length:285 start_codon:yes stop_codon:yes gene_type:complete